MPVVVGMRLRRQRLRLEVLTKLASRILQSIDESEAVLSLEIVGDVRMRRLNRTFRHRDKTTDVLAFATRRPGTAVSTARRCGDFLAAGAPAVSSP